MSDEPKNPVSVEEHVVDAPAAPVQLTDAELLALSKADLIAQVNSLKTDGLYLYKLEGGKAAPKSNTLAIPDSGDTALRIVLASGDLATGYAKLVAGDSRGPKWQAWVQARWGTEWRAKYAESATLDSYVMVLVAQSKAMPENKIKILSARSFLARLDALMSFFEVIPSMTVEEYLGKIQAPAALTSVGEPDCEL